MEFNNAQEVFEYFYKYISKHGIESNNTLFLNNISFYIKNPTDNKIKTPWRKWSEKYAELEWQWYLSKNNNVSEIKKIAKIWDKMHNGDNIVNSNYGYQWSRSNQIEYVINELKNNKYSRRAVLTIYDAKEHEKYKHDTPCTLNIYFNIIDDFLNMSVMMRSNDLWYGFCNDQYCFAKLQEMIADRLNKKIGWYYHHANDFHIYKEKLNKNNELERTTKTNEAR